MNVRFGLMMGLRGLSGLCLVTMLAGCGGTDTEVTTPNNEEPTLPTGLSEGLNEIKPGAKPFVHGVQNTRIG
ncbi:MAG: hypothetical protein IPK82_25100 [Polyangiaceae bacterium]|nr:hypothetical protein [Polyangiaceae bacterium]